MQLATDRGSLARPNEHFAAVAAGSPARQSGVRPAWYTS